LGIDVVMAAGAASDDRINALLLIRNNLR